MTVVVHLVDGTYELFRAHFSARPPHQTPDGRDAKAVVGLVQSVRALMVAERGRHIAVAFDNPIRSFRNDLFEGYKTDDGVPRELLEQFDMAEEAMRSMGVRVWSMQEFEADDALATAAFTFSKDRQVEQIRIYSPDKDLGQCLRWSKVVQVDRRAETVTDADAFVAKRGFAPESVPDFLALVGDTADGIPGLPGWGEKSAGTVLGVYPHLEDIPTRSADWKVSMRGGDRLSAALEKNRAIAQLYRTLATLRTDVPIRATVSEIEWRSTPDEFAAWAKRVGKPSLASKATPR